MWDVLESDPRNEGIRVVARYQNYVVFSTLVVDIKSVDGDKAPADVFRVLLQYAEAMRDRSFDRVILASSGKNKFFIEGSYFEQLGGEYDYQNPVYTMRTFPQHLFDPDGNRAFGTWTGGVLGVMGKQMEDFTEFHKRWYVEDL